MQEHFAIESSTSMSCRPSETWFPCVCRVYSGLVRPELVLLPFLQLHCQFLLCGYLFSRTSENFVSQEVFAPLSLLAETGKQVVKLLGSLCLRHSLCAWFIHLIFTGGAERYHWDADPNCSQMPRWVQQDKWKMRNNMSLEQTSVGGTQSSCWVMGMVINGILSTGNTSSVPRNLRAVGRLLSEKKKMFCNWQERARGFWSPIHLPSMRNHFIKERDYLIVPWRFPLSAYLTFPGHWWIGKIFQPWRDGVLRSWVGMKGWSDRTSLCPGDVTVCYWQKGPAASAAKPFSHVKVLNGKF